MVKSGRMMENSRCAELTQLSRSESVDLPAPPNAFPAKSVCPGTINCSGYHNAMCYEFMVPVLSLECISMSYLHIDYSWHL